MAAINKGPNCQYKAPYGRCENKNIPRIYFGIGPRMCKIWHSPFDTCEEQKLIPRPTTRPVGTGRKPKPLEKLVNRLNKEKIK